MFDKIEHIGIAVKNLEAANELYAKLLGAPHYKIEEVESESVRTSFFQVGPNKIELLESTNPDSAIGKFIARQGEGMHHIAYAVENIEAAMQQLKADGFRLLNEKPKRGADNKLVCFVHPKDCSGVLVELCQEIDEDNRIKSK
ncbi:MAG: methylmalonyl-CoA epimerase [Chitinophagales bacterium]